MSKVDLLLYVVDAISFCSAFIALSVICYLKWKWRNEAGIGAAFKLACGPWPKR